MLLVFQDGACNDQIALRAEWQKKLSMCIAFASTLCFYNTGIVLSLSPHTSIEVSSYDQLMGDRYILDCLFLIAIEPFFVLLVIIGA